MADETTETGEEAKAVSPAAAKKPYEHPVLTKLGALRDVTLAQWSYKGRRDGWKSRNTGRGGMNGMSRDSQP
jgi:hypothetical protein